MPKCTLTQKFVTDYTCATDVKKVELFDEKQKGLVLEVRQSGGKTFYLRMSDKRRKVRYYRLGYASDITVSQARELCQSMRTQIVMGIDPKQQQADLEKIPTLSKFVEEQYIPYVKSYKRSWKIDVSILNNHILPVMGRTHLDEITRSEVIQLHQSIKAQGKAPATANRVLIILRFLFNLVIEKWQMPGVTTNPAKQVPIFQENNRRERYLSSEEIQRLSEAAQHTSNPLVASMLGLLLVTGVRKSELLNAKWKDFNLVEKQWRIPVTKSGYARHVPLNEAAMNILVSVKQMGLSGVYVFPNPKTGKPYAQITAVWQRIRKIAGLEDVRLHDLRHSFASLLVNSGRTLYEVQRLLGHSQARTTQRYAHLSNDTLMEATNVAGERVSALWSLNPEVAILTTADPKEVQHVININTHSTTMPTLQEVFGTTVSTVPMEESNYA